VPPLEVMNYCPQCATPLEDKEWGGKIRRVCPACGFVHFRDPKVAVVLFIVQDGKVMLVKRAVDPEEGKWTLPAGFLDYGEAPREAAIREMKEETGLDIQITRLVDVSGNEDNSGKASVLILFEADVVGGTIRPADDAAEVRFFSPEEIPYDELAFKSNTTLLQRWSDGL